MSIASVANTDLLSFESLPPLVDFSTNNQISPFAQILTGLQKVQQTDLPQYRQLATKIASNLHTASQAAQSIGNADLAGAMTSLSVKFKTAAHSGALPNIPDLSQALSGRGRVHATQTSYDAERAKARQSQDPTAIILSSLSTF